MTQKNHNIYRLQNEIEQIFDQNNLSQEQKIDDILKQKQKQMVENKQTFNELLGLEEWNNRMKQKKIVIEKLIENQSQKKCQVENEQIELGPQIRVNLINQHFKDQTLNDNFVKQMEVNYQESSKVNNTQEYVRSRNQSSMDMYKHQVNKKLINQIIQNKLKKVKKSSSYDKKINKTKDEIEVIRNNILLNGGNFKSQGDLYIQQVRQANINSLIQKQQDSEDIKYLQQHANEIKEQINQNINWQIKSQQGLHIYKPDNQRQVKEQQLLSQLNQLYGVIQEKKQELNEVRIKCFAFQKRVQQELILKKKYQKQLDEEYRYCIKQEKIDKGQNQLKDFIKEQKIKSMNNHQLQQIQGQISKSKEYLEQILENIRLIEEDIDKLKLQKKYLRSQLKDFYYNIVYNLNKFQMTDEYSMLYILEQLSTLKQIINYDDFDVDGPTITFFKEYLNLYQQMMTMHCNNEQETNGSNYKTKKVWGLFEFDQYIRRITKTNKDDMKVLKHFQSEGSLSANDHRNLDIKDKFKQLQNRYIQQCIYQFYQLRNIDKQQKKLVYLKFKQIFGDFRADNIINQYLRNEKMFIVQNLKKESHYSSQDGFSQIQNSLRHSGVQRLFTVRQNRNFSDQLCTNRTYRKSRIRMN